MAENNEQESPTATADKAGRPDIELLSVPGTRCTLNENGDLFCHHEAREFIGAECVIVKKTKAGLIQVALKRDHKRTFSAPQHNVDCYR